MALPPIPWGQDKRDQCDFKHQHPSTAPWTGGRSPGSHQCLSSRPPSKRYGQLGSHTSPRGSYLQGHFLEVAPSPPDDVSQEEDGAVGMLHAVAAALQVGLVVGCQHVHPACREEGDPPCLPLCLPAQPVPPRLQRQEPSPTPLTRNRNGTLPPALSPCEPLHCWPRESSLPHKNDLQARRAPGHLNPGSRKDSHAAGGQGAPGPPGSLKEREQRCQQCLAEPGE